MATMSYNGDNAITTAAQFIREETALYRHYCIPEVQLHVEQFTGVSLSEQEATAIVQGIRDENGLGPIADYNLPGYTEDDQDQPETPEQHGDLLSWLFGR